MHYFSSGKHQRVQKKCQHHHSKWVEIGQSHMKYLPCTTHPHTTGSVDLITSKVFAWNREVSITFITSVVTKVRQVNLFFYNFPSSGIGLPPAELFWSNVNPLNPDRPLSHVIVGNQDLSQDDRTLRNVSLVVTTDQDSIMNYMFFRIHFTLPTETSLIDWILLSEVQLCGEAGMCVSVSL